MISAAIRLPQLELWPPLMAFTLPLVIGFGLMPWAIGRLASSGMGQRIREEGPRAHRTKSGTPTSGGLIVIALVLLTALVLDRSRQIVPVLAALVLGAALGMADDFVTMRGSTRGLLARQKIVIQLGIGVVLGYVFLRIGADAQVVPILGTWHMGWLIVPMSALTLVAISNAFNLTDGSDGLAPGVILLVALGLAFLMRALGGHQYVALERLLLATVGALAAFLAYNLPPARVFMGGVGAEGLGTMLAAAAINSGLLWYLPLLALVPLAETVSVILQVYYYRRSGKRLFRMAPLHHHFQLGGWSEWRIAVSAWVVSVAGLAVALVARPKL